MLELSSLRSSGGRPHPGGMAGSTVCRHALEPLPLKAVTACFRIVMLVLEGSAHAVSGPSQELLTFGSET